MTAIKVKCSRCTTKRHFTCLQCTNAKTRGTLLIVQGFIKDKGKD